MTATIRDLSSDDLGRALEINQANTPEVGSIDADRLGFLFAESVVALTAEVDAQVIGFVLVLGPGSTYDSVNYRWFMDRRADTMYLDRVAIDAGHRGMGHGRALYAAVFERLRASDGGMRRLGLEVNIDPPNPASMAFHRTLGFEQIGRQRTPYGAEVSLMDRAL